MKYSTSMRVSVWCSHKLCLRRCANYVNVCAMLQFFNSISKFQNTVCQSSRKRNTEQIAIQNSSWKVQNTKRKKNTKKNQSFFLFVHLFILLFRSFKLSKEKIFVIFLFENLRRFCLKRERKKEKRKQKGIISKFVVVPFLISVHLKYCKRREFQTKKLNSG